MSTLKKNFIYNIILSISSLIAPLITFPYVSHVLGPTGIGQVNFVNSYIQYYILFSALGIPIYGIREVAKLNNSVLSRSNLFFELLIIRAIITFFLLFPYIFSIFYVNKFIYVDKFLFFGIFSLFLSIFDINWFFIGMERIKFITIRSLLFQILQIILIFILIRRECDVFYYFLIPIVINLLNVILNIKYSFNYISFESIKFKDLNFFCHISPLLILFSSIVAISVYNLLDVVILGFISNNENVGYYTVASKINKIPITLITALAPVILPSLSLAAMDKDNGLLKLIINKSINFVLLLSIPITFGIIILSPELINIFGGFEFKQAILTVKIIAPTIIFIGLSNVFGTQILIPLNKEKYLLISILIGTIISIILNSILIRFFNQNGAALTSFLSELAVTISTFYFAKKILDFKINYVYILYNILLSLFFIIFAFIFRHIFNSSLVILILTILCSSLFYFWFQIYVIKNELFFQFKLSIFSRNE
jgi:O-antigen/teichoic acid export membrane protein